MIVLVSLAVAALIIAGTLWMGHNAKTATEDSVRAVSMMYLDELAGRREQVIATNLQNRIKDMETAISLLSEEDLRNVKTFSNTRRG